MTKTFVDQMDLDERGFIRDDWFHVRGLSGVLFPEQPALPEFEDLILLVGTDLAEVTIAHAEYGKPFCQRSFDGPGPAYAFVFSVISQEIFLRLNFVNTSLLV